MSITRVTRINLEGEHTNEDHTYVHTYEVEVSSRDDQQVAVLTAAGIPTRGQLHPSDPAAVVTSKRANLREERMWKLWIVTVRYAIVAGTEDAVTTNPTQPPDLRVPELRIRSAQREEAFTLDVGLKPLVNSAGELYPQHMRTITTYYAIISYRRWFRAVDLDPYNAVLNWCGKVNENEWFTADAGTVQIQGLTFEREFFANQLFFRTDFELAGPVSPNIVLPNEGMHVKTGFNVDGVIGRKPILLPEVDDSGNPTGLRYRVSEPVPISADGKKQLADGQPPILNTFRMYDEIDFADIGL
jgi:hypothetical protein